MIKVFNFFNILILNVWFYFWAPFVLAINLIFMIPLVVFSRLFGHRYTMYVFRRAIALYGKCVCFTAWPWIRIQLINPPTKKQIPYIFVENHTSSFDPFVQAVLPFEIVQFARNYALQFPLLGFIAKCSGYIDVNAYSPEDIIEKGKKLLEDKVSLVLFPEGTRHTDGVVGPFHSTAFKIALETNTPLVPVVIKGIENKPPKGSFLFQPGLIQFHCLEPVCPEYYKNMTPFKLKKYVRNIIKENYEN